MIQGLHTTWTQVSDMDRAAAFYKQVLGLRAEIESPYWTQFDLGNGKIALRHAIEGFAADGKAKTGWFLGLQTPDLRGLRRRLEEADAQIHGDYHDTPGGVVLSFADPDGNPIQAIQPGAKAANL